VWSLSTGGTNGLGLGTPAAGMTLLKTGVTGGVLYTTPVTIVTTSGGSQKIAVEVYVSTPFAHPSAVRAYLCFPISACTGASAYQAIATGAAIATPILPNGSNAGTYTASLAIFVAAVSGAGAFAGLDSAVLTFNTYKNNENNPRSLQNVDTLNLSTSVQTAVQLTLASAGGASIAAGSDYALNFGNVNGLGIGPSSGLSVTTSGTQALYRTPYSLLPYFWGFSASSGTLTARVSTDFAHPAVLSLQESPDSVTFVPISKTIGSPTTLTTSATSGSTVTRYLGLAVNGLNGASAFAGTDNAVIQFTLVVP